MSSAELTLVYTYYKLVRVIKDTDSSSSGENTYTYVGATGLMTANTVKSNAVSLQSNSTPKTILADYMRCSRIM
jgi:hypothetical protein